MHRWSQFSSQMCFFIFSSLSFENFKQLVLVHLDSQLSWELHKIQLHVSSQNEYFDFRSIPNRFLHHFRKLSLSRIPTRWRCLEAPKGCPIRKYSGECFAPLTDFGMPPSVLHIYIDLLADWLTDHPTDWPNEGVSHFRVEQFLSATCLSVTTGLLAWLILELCHLSDCLLVRNDIPSLPLRNDNRSLLFQINIPGHLLERWRVYRVRRSLNPVLTVLSGKCRSVSLSVRMLSGIRLLVSGGESSRQSSSDK